MHDRPAGSTAYSGYLISVVLGMAFYFLVFGTEIIHPEYVNWLSNGDWAQSYLGWVFFREASWNFPIIGSSPNFGIEIGNAIVYTDSNPLLAIIFKSISFMLPDKFQYFGIWILLCCILQSLFSWKIVSKFSANKIIIIAGTLLLLFIPTWINRVGHLNLMAHFLILASILLILDDKNRHKTLLWGLLICCSMLIHLYLTLMVSVFWGGTIFEGLMKAKNNRLKIVAFKILPMLAAIIFIGGISGYFTVIHGAEGGGFGDWRANLLTPFLASGWSNLINTKGYADGEREGFGYLGLGLILLTIINLKNIINCFTIENCKGKIFLLLPLMFFVLFAISNKIAFGSHVIEYPLPVILLKFCSIFRASGRFIWPITYLFIILIIGLTVKKYGERKALIILIVCTIIQIVDTEKGWWPLHKQFSNVEDATWKPNLKSDFWVNNENKYNKIRLVPFTNSSTLWKDLSFITANAHMQTNAVYMARFDVPKSQAMNQAVMKGLLEGDYPSDTLYVMEQNLGDMINLQAGDMYAKVDGVYVLAPKKETCIECEDIIDTTKLNKPEVFDFTSSGKGFSLLTEGWSIQEAWGVWNASKKASILLPIRSSTKTLKMTFNTFGPLKKPKQRIIIRSNNEILADLMISAGIDNTVILKNPLEANTTSKSIRLDFEFPDAIKISSFYGGADNRELAFGITKIEMK